MMSQKTTIELLTSLCDDYLAHLQSAIARHAKEMPQDVQEQYVGSDGVLDINALITQIGTGLSLYWKNNINKYQWSDQGKIV
jgi:hypothetical protein